MLPLSFPISIYDICDEFQVPRTTGLFSFYRGAGIVPNNAQNAAIPTSGPISYNQFFGTAKAVSVSRSPSTITRESVNTSAVLSGSVTLTASGGRPGYTYNTVWLSGGGSITITGATTTTPGVTSTGNGSSRTLTGTLRSTVTDSLGVTAFVDTPVSLTWGTA